MGIYSFCATAITSLKLDNLNIIGDNCFESCTLLKTVQFDNLKTFPKYLFQNCISLNSVSGLNTIEIGIYCFLSCSNLTEINLPSLKTISKGAFIEINSITEISFPKVTNIYDSVFKNCKGLQKVDLPSCNYLGSNAFDGCTSLKLVNIPLLHSASFAAFRSISAEILEFANLVELYEGNDENISYFGGTFMNCKKLKQLNIPLIKKVPSYMVSGCTSLYLLFLDMAESVGKKSFDECPNLMNLYIPKFTIIDNNAFQYCEKSFKQITG